MANVKQLKHLEHLEDELLNYGVSGCEAIVGHFREIYNLLGDKDSRDGHVGGFVQTKWDGAPSVICGTDPVTGIFFVGTKSVFNKVNPKPCASAQGIDELYADDKPGLAIKLKSALEHFSKLGIDGVIQGDLMWTEGDLKPETIRGERNLVFKPNTITYGIPVDHKKLSDKAVRSKIGVVFHTHYTGSILEDMQAKPGVDIKKFNNNPDVFVIDNDTPMDKVGLSASEKKEWMKLIDCVNNNCGKCGKFLDELVLLGSGKNPKGDSKYHIAPYVKAFFNSEIRQNKVTTNPTETLTNLIQFYHDKMHKLISGIKTPSVVVQKKMMVNETLRYLAEREGEFKAMIALYRDIQHIKTLVIDKLDPLEKYRTYILKEGRYEVTRPEGYVLHRDEDMVKFVDRLEFSKNNFLGGSFQT